jgi:hypothetical protein
LRIRPAGHLVRRTVTVSAGYGGYGWYVAPVAEHLFVEIGCGAA